MATTAATPALGRPLHGIVVVAVEQAVAAPFATRQLADLGATVIKVERRGDGDFARGYDHTVNGLASHFVWLNRNKLSIELDFKDTEDGAVLGQLIDRADVFIQNLAPAAAERAGLLAAQLCATRPRLVACDVSGYGPGGPYSHRKAYDLLIQCETGLVSVTGTEKYPSKVGISIADISAGMYAYSGILTALLQREQTGRGQPLEVTMLEALGEWMGYADLYARYGGTAPRRAGASHATIAPYGPFPTRTGQTVNLGLQNEREWKSFCANVLRQPELSTDPRFISNAERVRNVAELNAIIAITLATLDLQEVETRLSDASIAYAQQRTMAEFASHPQLRARNRWANIDTPTGPIEVLRPPVNGDYEVVMGPIPGLGEHSESIRRWLDAPSTVKHLTDIERTTM